MTQFEKLFNLIKKPWIISLYLVLVILVYFFADRSVALYFHEVGSGALFSFLKVFTVLGKWSVYVALFFLAGLYFRFVRKNATYEARAWYLLGCVLLCNLIASVIKVCLSRARPDLFIDSHLFGFYWFQFKDLYWSFPSGHAVTIFGLISGLAVLFPRYFYAFFCAGILVALSRVFLYRHYLSDVMVGSYLAVLIVGFFTDYLRRHHYLNKMK